MYNIYRFDKVDIFPMGRAAILDEIQRAFTHKDFARHFFVHKECYYQVSPLQKYFYAQNL